MRRTLPALLVLLLSSCSVKKMALVMTAETIGELSAEVQKYDVYFIVEGGLPSNILIMETARILDPRNPKILSALSELYCSYGFGFVEDENVERARVLYHKGYLYGEEALALTNRDFAGALQRLRRNEILPEELARTISKKDVKTAFWYASCLAYWINSSGGSPEAVAEISKMLAIVDRLIELDEGFFYGGPLLLRASFYSTAPSILGGSPAKSKIFFEKAFRKAEGKFLMAKVAYANYYAALLKDKTEREVYEEELTRLKDRIDGYKASLEEVDDPVIKDKLREQIRRLEKEFFELSSENVARLFSDKTGKQIFDEVIEDVLKTDTSIAPDIALSNEVAKEKARRLLAKRDILF